MIIKNIFSELRCDIVDGDVANIHDAIIIATSPGAGYSTMQEACSDWKPDTEHVAWILVNGNRTGVQFVKCVRARDQFETFDAYLDQFKTTKRMRVRDMKAGVQTLLSSKISHTKGWMRLSH